jgi:hypothetical protein
MVVPGVDGSWFSYWGAISSSITDASPLFQISS